MSKPTRPVRVRLTLVIDVNAEDWTLDYGVEGSQAIAQDVKEYIRNMINSGGAGFDHMDLQS